MRKQMSTLPDMTGRQGLVTGGAGGIGQATAEALTQAGAKVIIADLNQARGQETVSALRRNNARAKVRFEALDLGDLAAVERFCDGLLKDGEPLDLLFNNAGIQPLSTRKTTADNFELTFGIGHLGHYALTARLLPLLLAAPAPRVISTSSLVHPRGWFDRNDLQIEQGYEAQRAYNQTKLANLLFALELQRRAEQAGTKLVSVAGHPGVARTGIIDNRKHQGALAWRDHMVSLVLAVVMPVLGQDADKGALPLLHAAVTDTRKHGNFFGPQGIGGMKGLPGPARIAAIAQDTELAQWLWEQSAQLCKLDFALLNPPVPAFDHTTLTRERT